MMIFVCVCVFAMFVLACHSGFLEGYYFSMMILYVYLCEKLRSLNWLGGQILGMLKEEREVVNVEREREREIKAKMRRR